MTVDSADNLYINDCKNNQIYKQNRDGELSLVVTNFYDPRSVAVDSSGNVYVVDYCNHRIKKIMPDGEMSTFAGRRQGLKDGAGSRAEFNYPIGVTVDSAGTVYVADSDNNCIRKITPAGVVSTLAGSGEWGFADGPGTEAQFNFPLGVTVDSSGAVYVADSINRCIRKITPAGVVSTLAGGTGTGATAKFNYPSSVAVDSAGIVYVTDTNNHQIKKITPTGEVGTLAGSGIQGFADGIGIKTKFKHPSGVAVDSSGTVYVADSGNNLIRRITSAGEVTTLD